MNNLIGYKDIICKNNFSLGFFSVFLKLTIRYITGFNAPVTSYIPIMALNHFIGTIQKIVQLYYF